MAAARLGSKASAHPVSTGHPGGGCVGLYVLHMSMERGREHGERPASSGPLHGPRARERPGRHLSPGRMATGSSPYPLSSCPLPSTAGPLSPCSTRLHQALTPPLYKAPPPTLCIFFLSVLFFAALMSTTASSVGTRNVHRPWSACPIQYRLHQAGTSSQCWVLVWKPAGDAS